MEEPAFHTSTALEHPGHTKGGLHIVPSLSTLNQDVLAEIMDYLSPHDQSHLARTCRALHTATLSHRCSSSLITLSPSDRIISSFLAFLRLNANPSDPGNSRAPLIHKLSIATPTFPPVVDWHAFPEARTLGYRATYPAISDAVLAILTACTNLSTFRLDVWSGRLPADRLCTSIATLRGLEELQLTVTHARLWGETTALARLPKLRRLVLSLESPTANQTSEIVLESTPTPFALAATISPQTLTSLRLQLSYDSSATSIADACLPNVRILHLTLVQTDQVQPTPRHALPTPTLARAFPNLTHLTFGVRGWVGLDEHIAGQWRDANRAETSAAWPHLAVLCGLDVPDLWLLGLAHRVLHVCVGEADGLLGVHWPGEHFPEGPNGAAWAAGWVRRMLPAVLEDARPTHLELAATAPRTVFVGRNRNRREVNVVETLSVLGERAAGGKGAVGASLTHLLVNVPVPELMEKKILGGMCAALQSLLCTHLYIRVPAHLIEDARGRHYCASLLTWIKQRSYGHAALVAQSSPTLSHIVFHLEGVSLRAWSISRDSEGEAQLEEMSELRAWAMVAEEKLYAHQTEFSRSEQDIPALDSL